MKKLLEIPRVLAALIDAMILFTSPLFMIAIVVCVIVLLERGGEHVRYVQNLEDRGLTALATVEDDESPRYGWWYVRFDDPAQSEARTGFIDEKYYTRAVVDSLHRGVQVEIRYLPESYENFFVLEAHFGQVRYYWGFAYDIGVMFLISWLVVILHPEFLYIGYNVPWPDAIGRTTDRLSSKGKRR
jgi:hypothetical protein